MTSYCDKVKYWVEFSLTWITLKTRGVSTYHLKTADNSESVIVLSVANDKLLGYKFNPKFKIVMKEIEDKEEITI
jgi:hypothetical protein